LGGGTSRLGKVRCCAFGLRPRRSRMAQQGATTANTAGDDGHFALPHLLHLHGANPCSPLPLPRPSQVAGLQPCDCGDIPGSWRVRVRGSIIWGWNFVTLSCGEQQSRQHPVWDCSFPGMCGVGWELGIGEIVKLAPPPGSWIVSAVYIEPARAVGQLGSWTGKEGTGLI
jgi:hypothetical protein